MQNAIGGRWGKKFKMNVQGEYLKLHKKVVKCLNTASFVSINAKNNNVGCIPSDLVQVHIFQRIGPGSGRIHTLLTCRILIHIFEGSKNSCTQHRLVKGGEAAGEG